MSVTDISVTENKISIKFKLFTDDLEMTLRTFCQKGQVDLINIGFDPKTVKCLQEHIEKNFQLLLNDKVLPLKFLKVTFGSSADVSIIEMEVAPVQIQAQNTLAIRNTLMFGNLPEQKSVVNVQFPKTGKSETILIENEKEETMKKIHF